MTDNASNHLHGKKANQTDQVNQADQAEEDTNDWLDDISDVASETGSDKEADAAYHQRLADLSIVHAMLCHVNQKDQLRREKRVQSVLTAIDQDQQTKVKSTRSIPYRLFAATISAAAIFFVSFILLFSPQNSPASILARAEEAARKLVNLQYEIAVYLDVDRDEEQVIQSPPVNDLADRTAELYVRGEGSFVLKGKGNLNRGVTIGSNGESAFIVPPIGPVTVSQNPHLPLLNDRMPVRIPFDELTQLISLLKERFDLEVEAASISGERMVRLNGSLKANSEDRSKGRSRAILPQRTPPDRISVTVHPNTGRIYGILLNFFQEDNKVKVVRFELVGEAGHADIWFTHEAHHRGRFIRRINE